MKLFNINRRCKLALMLALIPMMARAQQNIIINMAAIDGIAITPDNVLGYQVQSSGSVSVQVKGTIRYRNSGQNISYSFSCSLKSGLNTFSVDAEHPQWQFSSPALRELFLTYKILPEGTVEYCVNITPATVVKENPSSVFDECLYHRAGDIFLINLVDPEDKAKLHEFNPMLSWIANYSFASQLTYRIRVAQIKQGQNAVNAVMRNQPVYDESNLMQNSIIYPVYAKPLEINVPYAWTVDAYYKGILLGGAESWQFIICDSTAPVVKGNRSYIDVKRENGANRLFALGSLKLKYVLDEAQSDVLDLEITDEQNKKCQFNPDKLTAKYGDNRYELDLMGTGSFKHKSQYFLNIKTKTGHEYKLPFQYLNPEYK
jgi:hypothetical protein